MPTEIAELPPRQVSQRPEVGDVPSNCVRVRSGSGTFIIRRSSWNCRLKSKSSPFGDGTRTGLTRQFVEGEDAFDNHNSLSLIKDLGGEAFNNKCDDPPCRYIGHRLQHARGHSATGSHSFTGEPDLRRKSRPFSLQAWDDRQKHLSWSVRVPCLRAVRRSAGRNVAADLSGNGARFFVGLSSC